MVFEGFLFLKMIPLCLLNGIRHKNKEGGVIAVFITWFYRFAKDKRIIEFYIIFDSADFAWGDADVNSNVMDLQNIATHELGHCLGLANLHIDKWSEQTMYGIVDYGETKKRTLESGDIVGIQALYGT